MAANGDKQIRLHGSSSLPRHALKRLDEEPPVHTAHTTASARLRDCIADYVRKATLYAANILWQSLSGERVQVELDESSFGLAEKGADDDPLDLDMIDPHDSMDDTCCVAKSDLLSRST
eukprot:3333220-Amphidinium_carterae.2